MNITRYNKFIHVTEPYSIRFSGIVKNYFKKIFIKYSDANKEPVH